MPIPNEIELPSRRATTEELANKVGEIIEQYGYKLSGFLDTDCAREFGGWLIKKGMLVSKDGDVGMSTEDTAGDDIRFWAGDAIDGDPKYVVTKSGILKAIGMILKSSNSGSRIEFANNQFKVTNSAGGEITFIPDVSGVPGIAFEEVGVTIPNVILSMITGAFSILMNNGKGLKVTSGNDIDFYMPSGKKINIDTWDQLKERSTGNTLESVLADIYSKIYDLQDDVRDLQSGP